MANQQTLLGSWNEVLGKIRSKWGQITQDELQQYKGNTDQLIGFLQRKTGESRDKIEKFLDEAMESGSSAMTGVVETAREYAHQAMDALGSNMGTVRDGAGQVADKVREGYESAAEMVSDRPGGSVAVAFGAGLVAGVLLTLLLRSDS